MEITEHRGTGIKNGFEWSIDLCTKSCVNKVKCKLRGQQRFGLTFIHIIYQFDMLSLAV